MSRYIRTEDGIYLKQEKKLKCMTLDVDYIQYNGGITIAYNIVAQADTIEELCDTGVVVNDTTKKIVSIAKEIDPNKYKWQKDTFTIYGAIWTDKGLIYVAKLNEKGEFELI